MIHLIDAGNRDLYRSEIADLHRARKRVFIDELGWDLPARGDEEWDEYDDDRAAQAVGFDCDGRVAMNGRFRPTDDGKVMLLDHFSHALWADAAPIAGRDTWEFSRALSLEAGYRRHNLRRKAACMLAPLEVALANGVRRFVGFSDLSVFPFFLTMGWRVRFLGDPVSYGQGDGAAFEVEVSTDSVESMRAAWDLPKPAHIRLTPEMVGDENPLAFAQRRFGSDPRWTELSAQRETAPRPVAIRLARRQNQRALAQLGERRDAVRDRLAG